MPRTPSIGLSLVLCSLMHGAVAGDTDDRPAGFVTLCAKDADCTVQTATNVAFGRDNRFAYKVLHGSFVCNATTFGAGAQSDGECSVPGRLLRTPARNPGIGDSRVPAAMVADSST
jgi:pectate lyase